MSKRDTSPSKPKRADDWVPDFESHFGSDRRGARQLAFTWRLMIASRKWRTKVDEALVEVAQTHARHEVLSVIKFAPSHISQRDLARFARLENPTLVRILDRLEQDGLIQRVPSDTDSRVKTVGLTVRGEEALQRQFQIGQSLRDRHLVKMSDDDLDQAAAILDKFIDLL